MIWYLKLSDRPTRSYPPSRKDIIFPWEWLFEISTIFFVIVWKCSDSKLIWDKGSLLWASNPAEMIIISGLNFSIFCNILLSNTLINSSPLVSALIGAL